MEFQPSWIFRKYEGVDLERLKRTFINEDVTTDLKRTFITADVKIDWKNFGESKKVELLNNVF